MKTSLIILTPLNPHYIVKLGFTKVYITFLILLKTLIVGTHKNRLAEAVVTSTYSLCFEKKYEKYQNSLSEKFPLLVVKFSIYLNRLVFVMSTLNSVRKSQKQEVPLWLESRLKQ